MLIQVRQPHSQTHSPPKKKEKHKNYSKKKRKRWANQLFCDWMKRISTEKRSTKAEIHSLPVGLRNVIHPNDQKHIVSKTRQRGEAKKKKQSAFNTSNNKWMNEWMSDSTYVIESLLFSVLYEHYIVRVTCWLLLMRAQTKKNERKKCNVCVVHCTKPCVCNVRFFFVHSFSYNIFFKQCLSSSVILKSNWLLHAYGWAGCRWITDGLFGWNYLLLAVYELWAYIYFFRLAEMLLLFKWQYIT